MTNSWLHAGNVAHTLKRRDWDWQWSHCGLRFPHTEQAGALRSWSKPCDDCFKTRSRTEAA